MLQKILAPLEVEVGKTASDALSLAVELAKTHGGKLILLHVVEHIPGYVMASLPPEFHNRARATGEEGLGAAAKAHGIEGSAELLVREGNPATEILECAKSKGVDTIVIGSHDPGVADYLLGSVAARVVRHAHCSVVVVRHPKT